MSDIIQFKFHFHLSPQRQPVIYEVEAFYFIALTFIFFNTHLSCIGSGITVRIQPQTFPMEITLLEMFEALTLI